MVVDTSAVSAQKLPKVKPAKLFERVINRGMRKGQRWAKRSVRELRKNRTVPLEDQEIQPGFRIVGTEHSWFVKSQAYENDYQYNLLTDLVVGEYDIDPGTGGYRDQKSFQMMIDRFDLLDSATNKNEDIRLLVRLIYSNDSRPAQRRGYLLTNFLNSEGLHRNMTDSLTKSFVIQTSMTQYNLGVVIDFPTIPKADREVFIDFVLRVKKQLNGAVYLCLPGINPSSTIFDQASLQTLAESLDGFLLRGYGYERSDTLSAGSPIVQNGPNDISRSVSYYIDSVKLPPQKLMVEFSYFGLAWEQKGRTYAKRSFHPVVSFDKINVPGPQAKWLHKTMSKTGVTQNGGIYTFDDAESLQQKYQWVKDRGLGGVAILGLGNYARKGREKPWEAIGMTYSAEPPQTVYPALAFLLMFFGFGIFVSVVQFWEVRNEIARKRRHQWFYGLSLFMIGIVVFCCLFPPLPPGAAAGSSAIMVMFPFLRRIRSKLRKFGLA